MPGEGLVFKTDMATVCMKLLSSGEDRSSAGRSGEYGKPWQEFLPSLGLVTGDGESGDGQDREGTLEEVMLNPRAVG